MEELYQTILDRKSHPVENSYTCYLFSKGIDKILKKCGEECAEVIIAAKNPDNAALSEEIADLLYHVLTLCAERGLPWSDVENVLTQRGHKIGNLKQMKNVDRET